MVNMADVQIEFAVARLFAEPSSSCPWESETPRQFSDA